MPSDHAHLRHPPLIVAPGTLEGIKWLALVFMILDHVNRFLLGERVAWMYDAGRLAMPLFAFVLAYNLARPGTLSAGVHVRTMKRLALAGAIATPPFIALANLKLGWWPLNILFTLLVATATIYLIEKGGSVRLAAAAALFLAGGGLVEFWWAGLAFCLAAWWYCQTRTVTALLVWVAASASLYLVNGNLWAMASIPIALAATLVDLRVPRIRHLFYVLYPAHLIILVLARMTIVS